MIISVRRKDFKLVLLIPAAACGYILKDCVHQKGEIMNMLISSTIGIDMMEHCFLQLLLLLQFFGPTFSYDGVVLLRLLQKTVFRAALAVMCKVVSLRTNVVFWHNRITA
jgi:hypothetical protein